MVRLTTIDEFENKFVTNQKAKKLVKIPIKDNRRIDPKWLVPQKHQVYVCDLIYMPWDKQNYKYIFVIVDACDASFDCEPIQNRESQTCVNALKNILKRKYITKLPDFKIVSDGGPEFRDEFEQYLERKNVRHHIAKSGRHSQTILVDRIINLISKYMNLGMLSKDLDNLEKNAEQAEKDKRDGKKKKKKKTQYYTGWRSMLQQLVNIYNQKKYLQKPFTDNRIENMKPLATTKNSNNEIYKLKTKVYVALDRPESIFDTKQHGNFRSSDIRWSRKEYTVSKIILNNDQPPMYMVKNNKNILQKNVAYVKQQLMVVPENI